MTRIRGYLAMSLDGFIAGPNDELAWLQESRQSGLPLAAGEWAREDSGGLEFEDFLAQVGAIVMGRRTFDIVRGFPEPWAYGDTPMLIVTSSELPEGPGNVTAFHSGVAEAIDAARDLARGRDVYVDGGRTLRAALDARLLDHLVITVIPTALGAGIPLFAGLEQRAEFAIERVEKWGPGMVQIHLTARGEPL